MADAVDAESSPRRSRWPERIDVGRIVKPHGVRGEVALETWGELGGALRPGATLYLDGRATELEALRGSGDRILARLAGMDTREAAEAARGRVLSVRSSDLPLPSRDEVYLFELDGCGVEVEHDGSVTRLGSVRRVIEDGGGLLLEVVGERHQGEDGDEVEPAVYLIPYVSAYLRSRDLGRGLLRFTLPEGLLETCVSTS